MTCTEAHRHHSPAEYAADLAREMEPEYEDTAAGRAQLAVDRTGHDTHAEARGER